MEKLFILFLLCNRRKFLNIVEMDSNQTDGIASDEQNSENFAEIAFRICVQLLSFHTPRIPFCSHQHLRFTSDPNILRFGCCLLSGYDCSMRSSDLQLDSLITTIVRWELNDVNDMFGGSWYSLGKLQNKNELRYCVIHSQWIDRTSVIFVSVHVVRTAKCVSSDTYSCDELSRWQRSKEHWVSGSVWCDWLRVRIFVVWWFTISSGMMKK